MFDLYRGLGVSENKLPKSPQTLEELLQPLANGITNVVHASEDQVQPSNSVTNAVK
jgi:hypothetical protein